MAAGRVDGGARRQGHVYHVPQNPLQMEQVVRKIAVLLFAAKALSVGKEFGLFEKLVFASAVVVILRNVYRVFAGMREARDREEAARFREN